jgi:hypothetical protein
MAVGKYLFRMLIIAASSAVSVKQGVLPNFRLYHNLPLGLNFWEPGPMKGGFGCTGLAYGVLKRHRREILVSGSEMMHIRVV